MAHIGNQRLAQQAARLGRDPRAPLSLEAVVGVLHPGEVLLDAFTIRQDGSLGLFLLQHGQGSIRWYHLIDGSVLQPLVDRWQGAHTTWRDVAASQDPIVVARRESLMAKVAATEQQVLGELGELVFAPVLEQLDESVTTLIVSPDGLLHRLPLAAVSVPGKDGQSRPLIERVDLQLVPTATSLAILRGPHGPRLSWPAALLAAAPFATDDVGDATRSSRPVADTMDVEDAATARISVSRDLVRSEKAHAPLPASGPEIVAVADLLEGIGCPTTVLHHEATRVRLEIDLPATRLLHLATHGGVLRPDETVLDYRIFLAGETEVRVRELYGGGFSLRDVFLVTLSACSLGEVMQQGAEALGLVQAFLQAGAGVVLAPLWAVDDRATKELMVRFYEELTASDGPTIASAWRRACTWMRTETPYTHPIYWAGFLPSGDASLRLTA